MNFTLLATMNLTPKSTIALWKVRRIQGLVWLSCNIISDKKLYHYSWSLSKGKSGHCGRWPGINKMLFEFLLIVWMLEEDIELGKECLGTIKFIHLNYWLKKLRSCRICTRLYCWVMVDQVGPGGEILNHVVGMAVDFRMFRMQNVGSN